MRLGHFNHPLTPVYYPFDFSLTLGAPNPWTAFRIIGSKSKLTQSPFTPSLWNCRAILGKEAQTYYRHDPKKHGGVKFQDYLLILGW